MYRLVGCAVLLCALLSWAAPPRNFEECKAKLKEWQAWADRNWDVPKYNQLTVDYNKLVDENGRLTKQNERLQFLLDRGEKEHKLMGFGIIAIVGGVSLGIVLAGVGWFRRIWPIAQEKKQLAVLLAGAVWITGAAVAVIFGPHEQSLLSASGRYYTRPVNVLNTMILYSVPAVLFVGIGLWWINYRQELIRRERARQTRVIVEQVEPETEAITTRRDEQ